MDVEDWPQSTWDHSLDITKRAAINVERVLEILNRHNKTITMFILGKFAERFPDLVKRIAYLGHEIASHGYAHIEIFRQTKKDFLSDIQRSKGFLEDLTGCSVVGYRAPDYTVTYDTLWTFEILSELGFKYDSSIYPSRCTRYGIPQWTTDTTKIQLQSGRTIVEIPLSTLSLLGHRLPVAGGGYHRLLPWPMIRWAIKTRLKQGQPFMTYCHPYEFDPAEFKEIDLDVSLKTRLHQGIGRSGFRRKFEHMLRSFHSIHAVEAALYPHWPVHFIDSISK